MASESRAESKPLLLDFQKQDAKGQKCLPRNKLLTMLRWAVIMVLGHSAAVGSTCLIVEGKELTKVTVGEIVTKGEASVTQDTSAMERWLVAERCNRVTPKSAAILLLNPLASSCCAEVKLRLRLPRLCPQIS